MPEHVDRKIVRSQGGIFNDITTRLKLILRLMRDPRVSPFLKIVPVAALVYLIGFPDLMIGPFDDAAVLWFGSFIFVELCPPEVVQEHLAALRNMIPGEWQEPASGEEDEIIDAEFIEEK